MVDGEINEAELSAAASAGMSETRKFEGKTFRLFGVAHKSSPQKCDALAQAAEQMKASGEQVRTIDKEQIFCVYLRVE